MDIDVLLLTITKDNGYLMIIISSVALLCLLVIMRFFIKKSLSFLPEKLKVARSNIPGGYNDNAIILYADQPKTISFTYVNAKGNSSAKEANIKTIFKRNGIIYLHGHCNSSNSTRTFRVDRIKDRTVNEKKTGKVGPVSNIFNI